jgi:hypothetical protein
MGDEMNGLGLHPGAAAQAANESLQRELLDRLHARWVVEIHCLISGSQQSVRHLAQGAACSAEPVQQDDAFRTCGCRPSFLARVDLRRTEDNERENQECECGSAH